MFWGMEFISAQIALSKGQHTKLLKSTMIVAKKNIICRVCNTNLKYPEKLKEHVEKKHPKFQCDVCATVFLTKSALKEHASVHK